MRKLNAIQELWLRTPEMVSSVMIGLLLMAIGAFVHHDILYGMVQVWRNDVTFYHCFCVGPIFLFLIYRKRQGVICAVPHFEPISLPVIIISGFGAYIFGEIGVNLLAHIAFVILLQALFIATIGRNGFKILRFPILFLFFLVPFGHELRLPLQNMTAAVAVFMLENSGVDVAFRGIYIATDRIEFVVAEACAGLRFLIANIFAMTLYAHFSFKTKKSWLIFLPLSIVIPIIGNILRAYFIMMIGYYSNGELAADIDHIIYGWGFFCLLAYVNFHIGEKISKAEPPMSEKDMDKIDLSYSYKAYNLEPIGSIFHKKHFPATIFALFAVFGLDYHLSRLAGRQGHFHAEHIQDYAPREISSVFAENWQKRQESVDFGFQNYDFTTYYTNVKNDVGAGVIHFKMQNSLKDVTASENRFYDEEQNFLLGQDKLLIHGAYWNVVQIGKIGSAQKVILYRYYNGRPQISENNLYQENLVFSHNIFMVKLDLLKMFLETGHTSGGVFFLVKDMTSDEDMQTVLNDLRSILE